MTIRTMWLAALALSLGLVHSASAIGVRGGGGGGRSGGMSSPGARPGGMSRPGGASRPSVPNLGGGGGMSRPPMGNPSMSRPSGGLSRPAVQPPVASRPAPPSGGLRPSTRPGLPATGGQTRPGGNTSGGLARPGGPQPGGVARPGITTPGTATPGGIARPTPRPGTSSPNLGTPRPTSRPGVGTTPGVATRPGGATTLPGQIGQTRPGGVATLPGTRPGGTTTLPGTRPGGTTTLPGTRPGGVATLPGSTRPGSGAGTRPSPDDIGDYLGIQRPRPGQRPGTTRPGDTRPGTTPGLARPSPGTRPGGATTLPGTRPGGATTLPGQIGQTRPGATRPGGPATLPGTRPAGPSTRPARPGDFTARPAVITRPAWSTRPHAGNQVISQRPSWSHIGNTTQVNIHNHWNNAFVRPAQPNWWARPSHRVSYWGGWGNNVRHHWSHYHHCHNWFNYGWWYGHPHSLGGWHYQRRVFHYPPVYWWTVPTWPSLTAWFTWGNAPQTVWQQPVYYDYGTGGNVVYQNNNVYVGGEQIASAADYAMSAADLATVPPPADEAQAEAAEWMPLGTFAVATSEKDVDPTRVVQLAVSKEGIISGTLYNPETDEAQTVQGQVDRETQRVAVRIGNDENLIIETGLYNLTLDEVPVLVHFGPDHTENWLLVRLEANSIPEADEQP